MKRLNSQPEDYLFIQVDTVAKKEKLTTSEEIEAYSKFRKMQDNTLGSNVTEDYEKLSHLFVRYNQIASISMAFYFKGSLRLTTITGEEEDIIKEFYSLVTKFPHLSLAGFGIVNYQLPIIRKKALYYGMSLRDIPTRIMDSLRKVWDLTDGFLDLGSVYKGAGMYYDSLEDVCIDLGISTDSMIAKEDLTKYFHRDKPVALENSKKVLLNQIIPLYNTLMGREASTEVDTSQPKLKAQEKTGETVVQEESSFKKDLARTPVEKLFVKGTAGFIDEESYGYFKEKMEGEKYKINRQAMYDVILAATNFDDENKYVSNLKELI